MYVCTLRCHHMHIEITVCWASGYPAEQRGAEGGEGEWTHSTKELRCLLPTHMHGSPLLGPVVGALCQRCSC